MSLTVDQAVEVHAGDEGNAERDRDDALASEQLARNHGVLCALPLPESKCNQHDQSDDERRQDVGAVPRMGEAAGLQRNKAEKKSVIRSYTHSSLTTYKSVTPTIERSPPIQSILFSVSLFVGRLRPCSFFSGK